MNTLLPSPLFLPSRSAFVGRGREITELHHAFERAMAAEGRAIFLVGEPGIGKTRLADELITRAVQHGALGLWGRCWEGAGAPAFWPWIQMLRTYIAYCGLETLQVQMGTGAADIARIIPELRGQFPDIPQLPGLDSDDARFGFFDSLTNFFKTAAIRQPLVFVLDDLHWADVSSLLFLQFLTRNLRDVRLLVIGTYRGEEIGPDHPFTEVLGSLARESQQILLQGLVENDVSLLVEALAGIPQPLELIRAVCEKTEGNPFFVSEIIRWLMVSGQLEKLDRPAEDDGEGRGNGWTLSLPQGVRETIRRRFSRLSNACRRLLSSVAVVGRECSLALLQGVIETSSHDEQLILSLVDEACAAQILAKISGTHDRYRFTHALMRETLYEDLSLSDRVRLHRHIAETLETLYASQLNEHILELADHFFHAAPSGCADKALRYLILAAKQTQAVFAYDTAISYAQRALDLNIADVPQRCLLMLILGESSRLGEAEKAKEILFAAADLARQLGNAEYLARAAIGLPISVAGGVVNQPLVELCEEALAKIASEKSTVHARLLARLSLELYFSPDNERRLRLSQRAIDMARALGDPATLSIAVNSRYWALWGPQSTPQERIALASEVLQAAQEAQDFERIIVGHGWRTQDFLATGDMVAFDTELGTLAQVVEKFPQPQQIWFLALFRVMRALVDGRLDEAEQLAQEALMKGQAIKSANAMPIFGAQLFVIRSLQGRLAELEFVVKGFVEQNPAQQGGLSNLAFIYSELGREAEARAVFEQFAVHDFGQIPRDSIWLSIVSTLAQICAFLEDRERASLLYTLLLPYADQNVLVGPAACTGSVSLRLGLLATTLLRWTEARQHFEDALTFHTKMGASLFVVQTQYAYARTLLIHNVSGDLDHAQALLQAAQTAAQELEMQGTLEKVEALQAQFVSSVPYSPEFPGEITVLSEPWIFRKGGGYWTLGYAGTSIRLRNAKGLQYLSILLQEPGREFHVFDLTTLVDPPPARGARQQTAADEMPVRLRGAVDGDPHTDMQARSAYRQRTIELQQELEEAEQRSDSYRIESIQKELSFVSSELASAYGFTGHAQQRDAAVEKARKAVGNRIRASLNHIKKAHPELWRHLFAAVKTGTFCAYRPEIPSVWEID